MSWVLRSQTKKKMLTSPTPKTISTVAIASRPPKKVPRFAASELVPQSEPSARRPSLIYNQLSPFSAVKFRKRLSFIPAQLRSALRKPGQARRVIPVYLDEEEETKTTVPITEVAHQQDSECWKLLVANRKAQVTPGPVAAAGLRIGVTLLVVLTFTAVVIGFITTLLSWVWEPAVRKYLPKSA